MYMLLRIAINFRELYYCRENVDVRTM